MWGEPQSNKQALQDAIEFTGNHELYGSWMIKVADSWKYSCEHNLTKLSTNRRSWIGQAAVAMAINVPEDIVRKAWGYLTKEQQNLANNQADIAIKYWEEYVKN